MAEFDPVHGTNLKQLGTKADGGKVPVYQGLFDYFPRACISVAKVSQLGANKYAWKGWESVPNGIKRYKDGLARHILYEGIEGPVDSDTGLFHLEQQAWNAMAALELFLREQDASKDPKKTD